MLGFTNGGLNLGFIGKVKEKTQKFNHFSGNRESVNERRRRKEELRRHQQEEKLKSNQNGGSKNGHHEHLKRGIQEQAKYYDANADWGYYNLYNLILLTFKVSTNINYVVVIVHSLFLVNFPDPIKSRISIHC